MIVTGILQVANAFRHPTTPGIMVAAPCAQPGSALPDRKAVGNSSPEIGT